MGLDVQIEVAKAVATERVGAALQDDGGGLEDGDDAADDFAEEPNVVVVFHSGVEGDVDGVVGAWVSRVDWAGRVDGAGAGEEVLFVVAVEGGCHDTVGGPEGLFDAVAVMNVDVDVEDARVVAEELQNGEDDIIDVAEAGCHALFGVMETTGPVDGDVGLGVAELARSVDACAAMS